jgi:hypothetical protein
LLGESNRSRGKFASSTASKEKRVALGTVELRKLG